MKIEFTESQNQFRSEIRDWFSQNVPSKPLASFDTKEGFEEIKDEIKNKLKGKIDEVELPEGFKVENPCGH